MGQLARFGFNTRTFIGPAFVITAISLWLMSHWNTQIGPWQVTGPVMLQGIGTGLVFPQLSAISLSAVPRERMGYASSLFNMMRNTGAAIGISFLTAIFVSHQQIHQSRAGRAFLDFRRLENERAAAAYAGQSGVFDAADAAPVITRAWRWSTA